MSERKQTPKSKQVIPWTNVSEKVIPPSWPDWVKQILKEFELAEAMADEAVPDEQVPLWVVNMAHELTKPGTPSAQMPKDGQSGPNYLGALVGHYDRLLDAEDGIALQFQRGGEKLAELDEKLRGMISQEAFAQLQQRVERASPELEELGRVGDQITERKQRAMKTAMQMAIDRPFAERTEFFRGYSHAVGQKIFDEEGRFLRARSLSAPVIYTQMILNWEQLDGMSFYALYKRFCRLLGAKNAGSLDGFKKLLKRHGYNPGVKPGCPRKNPDTK